jgi:hypothetical protein
MRLWTVILVMIIAAGIGSTGADASTVTFTGTVSYAGPYSGDTLYVAALDTTQADSVALLGLQAYPVGSPPFDQAYSLSFDNATAPAEVIIAALLDVDGGGTDSVGVDDILGWYDGSQIPTGVSSGTSQSGLDFALPRAEVEGTVTLAPGQTDASITILVSCTDQGSFGRPSVEVNASGPYHVRGLYAGTYCGIGFGFIPAPPFFVATCYGDPTCANPTPITLGATEIKQGIDFDFTGNVRVDKTTWGRLKSKY